MEVAAAIIVLVISTASALIPLATTLFPLLVP
jgi:hypothetical protein